MPLELEVQGFGSPPMRMLGTELGPLAEQWQILEYDLSGPRVVYFNA